jgi:hypothetical protein
MRTPTLVRRMAQMSAGENNVGRITIRHIPHSNFISFYRQWEMLCGTKLG